MCRGSMQNTYLEFMVFWSERKQVLQGVQRETIQKWKGLMQASVRERRET